MPAWVSTTMETLNGIGGLLSAVGLLVGLAALVVSWIAARRAEGARTAAEQARAALVRDMARRSTASALDRLVDALGTSIESGSDDGRALTRPMALAEARLSANAGVGEPFGAAGAELLEVLREATLDERGRLPLDKRQRLLRLAEKLRILIADHDLVQTGRAEP